MESKQTNEKNKDRQYSSRLHQGRRRNFNKSGRTAFKHNVTSDKPKFKKPSAFARAMEEYKKIKEENKRKSEEHKMKKEEMNKALEKYKERKYQRFKKMSRKTKKGQPVMKYWMEDILARIQNGGP